MSPLVSTLLTGWELRPEIILTLGLAAVLHIIGWRRLSRRGRGQFQDGLRSASYLAGLVMVAVALMSPIDGLAGQLFFMHMIQHLLLVMVAVPLLLVADPFPYFMWGLPRTLRREVGRLLARDSWFRRGLKAATGAGVAWLLYVATLLGWHDPNAYSAAQGDGLIHDLEHLTFFGTALLFWWHATAAGPHVHRPLPRGARIAYLIAAAVPTVLAGIVISFSTRPIYPYYEGVPRVWGLTVLEDQMLSGTIMWIPGGMMYLLAALLLIARNAGGEDRKEPLSDAAQLPDARAVPPPGAGEAIAAPGMKQK